MQPCKIVLAAKIQFLLSQSSVYDKRCTQLHGSTYMATSTTRQSFIIHINRVIQAIHFSGCNNNLDMCHDILLQLHEDDNSSSMQQQEDIFLALQFTQQPIKPRSDILCNSEQQASAVAVYTKSAAEQKLKQVQFFFVFPCFNSRHGSSE